jgi:formylglycine-generating enzyme required for sulfatase activity
VNAIDGQTYLWIPAGEFTMGCSPGDSVCDADEQPAHQVAIRKGFWLGRTEETGAQYRKVRPAGGSSITPESPVTDVMWAEAKSFCTAVGGRLPSEAEWEYAARAGVTARAYGPLDAIAWFAKNSEEHAHPAGLLRMNRLGLFDMLGNVHEWVLDRYFNQYDDEQADGPIVEPVAPNASATVRGGAWTSLAKDVRVSARLAVEPDRSDPTIGFRCAMD